MTLEQEAEVQRLIKDIGTEHLVKYANHLALDLLKDKDGVYAIREYFLK